MKFRMKRFSIALFMIGVMVMSQMTMVFAADTSAGVATLGSGEASITIQGNAGQSLAGKTWKVHRLFDAENAVGQESIQYTFNPAYKSSLQKVVAPNLAVSKKADEVTEYEVLDYMQSLNNHLVEGAKEPQQVEGTYSDYRYFVEALCKQLKEDGVNGEQVKTLDTTSNNSIVLKGLTYGYYLIEDVTNAQGQHTAVSLSIVTTANPNASVNIKSDYPTVVKKIFEDNNGVGWNDIGDFEIGQLIPYKYESTLPNMNGYDKYYYAWHDVMDEALTLQDNSIEIKIAGTLNGTSKEYELSAHEFSLVTGGSDTFQIQIEDIKKIVDREFPQKNALSENIYGQKVTVTYQAVLNEKAIKNTGRPGFENDVRLEFSNDPTLTGTGKTGFTPWDTVVCFTYRVDGMKVNNKGKALANAKFKLYYDENCKKEVFVKAADGGYMIVHEDSASLVTSSERAVISSDAKGEFVVFGLDGGTYYLKEIEAPAGYRPILDPIKIDVKPDIKSDRNGYVKGTGATSDVLVLNAKGKITTFVDGDTKVSESNLTTNADTGSLAISIVNQIGAKLPMTGSYMMPILFAAGILSFCMALKTRKAKYE